MSTNSRKRPIGLKAQQKVVNQNQTKKIKQTKQDDDNSFTTVALIGKQNESDVKEEDGLNYGDLIQLKIQAEELIDNPTGLKEEEDQLVNLLRGICHEAIRLIEIAERESCHHPISTRLPHQLIAWATFQLGVLLELDQKSKRLVQPDEPKSFDAWLDIVTRVLDKLPSKDTTTQNSEEYFFDLELLPNSVRLLKAQDPTEILTTLKILFQQVNQQTQFGNCNYLLRTIDQLILLKSDLIERDATPIFNILIDLLKKIRNSTSNLENKINENIQDFHCLIDQRLGDYYLTHGSLLVEKLENLYYPQVSEDDANDDQKVEEEEFKFDLECPTYKLSLETLRLAEQTFSNLLADKDESHELNEILKSKLQETLLTIGNLMPPGPEREDLYLRAGLDNDE